MGVGVTCTGIFSGDSGLTSPPLELVPPPNVLMVSIESFLGKGSSLGKNNWSTGKTEIADSGGRSVPGSFRRRTSFPRKHSLSSADKMEGYICWRWSPTKTCMVCGNRVKVLTCSAILTVAASRPSPTSTVENRAEAWLKPIKKASS